jgi:alkylation response protein AidB-like acyl-CoA dehydrogenase
MDFTVDEELEMLQQTAQKLVRDKLIPLENKLLAGGAGVDEEVTGAVEGFVEEIGLWGMNVPEEFEGIGLPVLGGCLVAFELGRTFISVPVGDVSPLLFECSAEQRPLYLDPVVAREKRMAVAFRDVSGKETRAVRDDGDGWVLDGCKRLGPGAASEPPDFLLAFARTGDDEVATQATTCFLVDAGAEGLTLRLDGKAPHSAEAAFASCRVKAGQVLGEPDKAYQLGRRWFPAVRVRKAAGQLGTAERLVEISAEYARDWTVFGRSLAERQSVRQALADSAAEIYAAKNMVYNAAWLLDEEKPAHRQSMMVKLFVGQLLDRVSARSVEIHGGPLPHFGIWQQQSGSGNQEDPSSGASSSSHADLLRAGLTRGMIEPA